MPNERVCTDCGVRFRRNGRPPLIPRCLPCSQRNRMPAHRPAPAVAERLRQSLRETDEYETVWNGGEGLCSGGGSTLADIR
jgi:predicted  nucleic acid-binding Zn-ribbon protein